jgi:hypothetical protein
MTEPQAKAAKDRGDLSETAKAHLVELYVEHRYGRIKMDDSKYMDKGRRVEEDAITLYSRYSKTFFRKNSERLYDDYISGEPDIFTGEHVRKADLVVDTKAPYDLFTFTTSRHKPINKDYYWQLQGYGILTGAKELRLVYCLVDTPDELIEDEKRRLAYDMHVIDSMHSPEYIEACKQIDINSKFADIPLEERVFVQPIVRDPEAINVIYSKVEKCREWLLNTFYTSDTLSDVLEKSIEIQNQLAS